jgi:hypothetical protein
MPQPLPAITPATSIAEVISAMEMIAKSLPENDGLACFNRMYLEVTQLIGARVDARFFADPAFIDRLDVTFANLYFDAVSAAGHPGTVPLAWQPLIDQRADPGIEPIQFALAGMNAHISHDLPLAVVDTCATLGSPPAAGDHHADYQKVDGLLDAQEESVRRSFENAAELAADRHLSAVANLVANWSINDARDVAWANALVLWELRNQSVIRQTMQDALAATVALSSRMLLVAV